MIFEVNNSTNLYNFIGLKFQTHNLKITRKKNFRQNIRLKLQTYYTFRFFSSIRIHSYIVNGFQLKYLIKKNTNLNVCILKKSFFPIPRKQELIEQNEKSCCIQCSKIAVHQCYKQQYHKL